MNIAALKTRNVKRAEKTPRALRVRTQVRAGVDFTYAPPLYDAGMSLRVMSMPDGFTDG